MDWAVRSLVYLGVVGSSLLASGCLGSRSSFVGGSDVTGKIGAGEVIPASSSDEVTDGKTRTSESKGNNPMLDAEQLFKAGKFSEAESIFADIADDKRNRPEVAEKARFYQAECLRERGYLPSAVDGYNRLLKDFPNGVYRERACGQMFLIANEWLEPTRQEIRKLERAERAKKGLPTEPESEEEKKRREAYENSSKIIPVNFDRRLPTFATESRALEVLENVYQHDPTGPYADQALFMIGRVKFHRGEYSDADTFFSLLVDQHGRSPLRDKALELAILSKTNSAGGPEADGRPLKEAMRLINLAKSTSPEMVRSRGEMLDEQTKMVRYQQAEKDFNTAELYRRTGKYGSAWYYYDLVIRRYPDQLTWVEKSKARMQEIQTELERSKDPSFMESTRRFMLKYVLGTPAPTLPEGKEVPKIAQLPSEQSTPKDAPKNLPKELQPRP